MDGRSYEVSVEELDDAGHFYPSPHLHAHHSPAAPAPAAAPATATPDAAPAAGPDDLCAPLAGVVVAVTAQTGQQVSAGEKLLVIEAMKMKTQVNAHKSGKVVAITVNVGDGVDSGQLLLTIA